MEEKAASCPICGISCNDLQSHLSNHSKEEIINAYSCKSERNSIPVDEIASTSATPNLLNQTLSQPTKDTAHNAYNTLYIPMNPSTCGTSQAAFSFPMTQNPSPNNIAALQQPAFSFPLQQNALPGKIQIPNVLPVQNPFVCMPQNLYPNFMTQNIPFQTPVKGPSTPVNLSSSPTLNIVGQTFPMTTSPKVVQQQGFITNTGFPNMQQGTYPTMQMVPFYSPNLQYGVPNYSFFGNNMYTPSPMPAAVQITGITNMSSNDTIDNADTTVKNPNCSPTHPKESTSVLDNNNQTSSRQETLTPIKQCYYVGDKEALVSIGDDIKLIVPKDILCKEAILGEILREQLVTAITNEFNIESQKNDNVYEKQVLELPEYYNSSQNESTGSSSKLDKRKKKYPKTNNPSKTLKPFSNVCDNENNCLIYCKKEDMLLLDDDTDSEVFENEKLCELHEVSSTGVQSSSEELSNEEQKPLVIKMFSNSSETNNVTLKDEDFLFREGIKCFIPKQGSSFTDQITRSIESCTASAMLDICDVKSEIFKSDNYDYNSNHQEEKLSLKSSETLEHSDSESPSHMQNQIQDLICMDEPGVQAMSSPTKICSSEFSVSNSGDHINYDLEKENLLLVATSFLPDFLSAVKEDIPDDIENVISKNKKDIECSPLEVDFFLEPFASTSGLQKKHSLLNKSIDQEEYDFDYESDYFDSDSDIYPGHKNGHNIQWKCSKCQKSFKSLKEKLLHSGCHIDDSCVRKESPVDVTSVKVELIAVQDGLNESNIEIDDVLRKRLKILRSPFSCSICFITFNDQITTTQHRKTHSISELKCQTCNKQIKSFSQWTEHQLFHYGASKHECKYCGKRFERRSILNIHVRNHTGQRPFKCQTCGKKFVARGTLKSHMLTHLSNQDVECDICNKKMKSSCLTRHKMRYHSQKKQISFKKKLDHLCLTCDAVFQTERKLLWHQETHNRWPRKCKYCGECFVHQNSLTKHIRLKHNSMHVPEGQKNGVSVACPVCHKLYTSSSLHLHMRTHNGNKPFKCLVCAKEFSVKCNLTNHMWVHAGGKERPYRCNLCDRSYYRKTFLEAHIRSHKKIKQFTCNECGKSFTYKYNLSGHMKEHFGEKQHLCSYCGKAFFKKYNLKDHVRIHTGETPFSCTICNKEFTQKSNYNVHIKAFHVERHVLDEEV